jgi:nicotinate-nucleotide--dimethylbenzimidazole phosphoribosyltransferase
MPRADSGASDLVASRAAQVLRPQGALARLDELAAWVAQWHQTSKPALKKPVCVIFGADHGVADAGVSAYPPEVTAAMQQAIESEKATINALGRVIGVPVHFVDVGVGDPTGDITVEAALSTERFIATVEVANHTIAELDADLLIVGELGIGNTTAAAAVAAAIVGGRPEDWVGRGTGVDDAALNRKVSAVRAACARVQRGVDGRGVDLASGPLETLRQVGGAELVAIAAAVVAARHRRLPVLLDGYVTTAAVAPVAAIRADALAHCWAAHCSAEPGHARLLTHLGLAPLLQLEMRLGEGSGAMAAVPLVAMACAAVTEVPTFAEWFN